MVIIVWIQSHYNLFRLVISAMVSGQCTPFYPGCNNHNPGSPNLTNYHWANTTHCWVTITTKVEMSYQVVIPTTSISKILYLPLLANTT